VIYLILKDLNKTTNKRGGFCFMDIRRIKRSDIKKLMELINDTFSDYPIPVNWTEREFELDMVENRISLEDSFFLCEDERPIGFIVIALTEKKARIDSMGVLKEKRGTGSAEYLLQHALENLKWKKVTSVNLEVIETGERAISFYKKHGFSVRRKLYTLIYDLDDYTPHVYLYKDATTHTIHELAVQASSIYSREPNWQRRPSTLENSGDRYNRQTISDPDKKGHPIGYLVWGENEDNVYIVDLHTVNPEYELLDLIQDAKRYMREETGKKKGIIQGIPGDDDLFDDLVESGAEHLFKQLEMELRLR